MSVKIVDVIPVGDSAETAQNSEPSLAVDPNDPTQIIAGAFAVDTAFFLTTDGGTTWSDYASLVSDDKSLAWKTDGSGFLASTLKPTPRVRNSEDIPTYSGTISATGFGAPINTFAPRRPDSLDQPWVRTGPSNHVYVAYNNLNNFGTALGQGKTASVNVSTNGGTTFTPVVIDRVGQAAGGPGQDSPAVRLAVNGSTVYAVFVRWDSLVEDDAAGFRYQSHVVVVRSDNAGTDSFTALGTGGIGSDVAQTIATFSTTDNSSLTLGQERTGSDLAIAVDPNNPSHLVVAYEDAPGPNGSGRLQLIVSESTDGGMTWATKFTTDSATRSAQPALAILADGTIGFLYDNYDPVSDKLSQHLLETADDFATTSDTVLATETNTTPVSAFDPYLGDFFDLEGIGNTFYGVFSASNADDGTKAQFSNVAFQRDFTGTPGTASFQLTDGSGNPVAASIDPFFFTATDIATPSPAGTGFTTPLPWIKHGGGFVAGEAQYADLNGDGKRDLIMQGLDNTFYVSLSTGTGFTTPTPWIKHGGGFVAGEAQYADLNGDGKADLIMQGLDNTFYVSLSTGTGFTTPAPWIKHGGGFVAGEAHYADLNGDGKADLIMQGLDNTFYVSLSTGAGFTTPTPWIHHGGGFQAGEAQYADLNGDGKADLIMQGLDNTFYVSLSTGTGFTTPLPWVQHGGSFVAGEAQYADLNGDGKTDLIMQGLDNTFYASLSTGTPPAASPQSGASGMTSQPAPSGAMSSGAPADPIANGAADFNVVAVPSGDLVLTAQPVPETFDFGGWMFGKAEITGFDPAQDAIRLSSGLVNSFASVAADMSAAGGATLITFDAFHSLTLDGVAPASLGAANFRFT